MTNGIKCILKQYFPRSYQRLRSAKEHLIRQGRTEYKILREIVRKILRGKWKRSASWTEVLPLQTPRKVTISEFSYRTLAELCTDLNSKGVAYSSGEGSVYLPPASLRTSPFSEIGRYYPSNVGLKVMTETANAPTNGNVYASKRSAVKKCLSRAGELILVANLLYTSKLGPRLYDLIQFKRGEMLWQAYVLEHIDGSCPSASECEDGLNRIRELERFNLLRPALPGGFEHPDFQDLSCNGNVLIKADGNFQYLGFQNFALADYERYLEQVAVRSIRAVHFGEESLLRNRRFLYQSVPGVRMPAKRSIEDRIVVIEQLMESAGLTVDGRLVLDVGCNAGMMMAEYLKRGAVWSHGWDTEAVTPHTDALLLALGCTRFSTTGAFIERTRRLEEDLPDFARSLLPGCVVSYLAVRLHLGWLAVLAHIPWSFLIYEGHQYETQEHFAAHIDQLRNLVDVEVVNVGSYREGFSNERIVAILANSSNKSQSGLG